MVWSIIIWLLLGALVAWITSTLWRHPQGCMMDGLVSVVGMVTGVILYGAIVGSAELLELNIFSLLSGVAVAFLALAAVRAWRRDVQAETEPLENAEGWEPEEAPPKPDKPLSERDPEDVGEGPPVRP